VDRRRFGETAEAMETSSFTLEQVAAETIAKERVDYRAVYRGFANNFLALSPTYDRFLYEITARLQGDPDRRVRHIEGISTIYLGAALRDNGGGHLIGTELEPGKVARARSNLDAAGLGDLAGIREGDALETLKDCGGEVDLLLIDDAFSPLPAGAKAGRSPAEAWSGGPRENAFQPGYLDYVHNPANGYDSQSLPIDEGNGNEFTVRTL
jgi:hypothetical protein